MKEDLTLDDEQDTTNEDLEKEFVRPAYTFRGEQLAPYTAGTDLLFRQVTDRNDDAMTVFMAFIFLHLQPRDTLLTLCWNKLEFRKALVSWMDKIGLLSNDEQNEVVQLFTDIRGAAIKASVELTDDKKKSKKATTRRKSRS